MRVRDADGERDAIFNTGETLYNPSVIRADSSNIHAYVVLHTTRFVGMRGTKIQGPPVVLNILAADVSLIVRHKAVFLAGGEREIARRRKIALLALPAAIPQPRAVVQILLGRGRLAACLLATSMCLVAVAGLLARLGLRHADL